MTAPDRDGTAATDGAVSELAASVGLSDADLVAMYRTVALARAVDERMWILNRAGRIPFVISGQGHEGAQVGLAWPLRRKHDWVAPFYRSIATCLAMGMTPRDLMLAQYAKASDAGSAGRQMPGHYGGPAYNIVSVSSPVATQILHAVGIALRVEDPGHRPGGRCHHGRGELQPGRRPRGAQLRRHPPAAVRVHGGEQRLCDQRAGRAPAERQGRGLAGCRVRDPGRGHGRHRRPRLLLDVPRCRPPGARRGWSHLDRGQGHPAHGAFLGRPADQVPLRGRPCRRPHARPFAHLRGTAAAMQAC